MSAEPPEIFLVAFSMKQGGCRMLNKTILTLLALILVATLQAGCGGSSGPTYSTSSYGAATLSWSRATTYTDGSTLTPAGYKIYYGTASGTYSQYKQIPLGSLGNPNSPSYTLSLPRGATYYFAIAVYDASNVESSLSAEVSKTVR